MKSKKPKPIKQLPLFNGDPCRHDRYFQTKLGMYEMISGWSGGFDRNKWEIDIIKVDPTTRIRLQPEIVIRAVYSDVVKKVKEFEQSKINQL